MPPPPCPEGVDPEYWAAIPDETKEEIAAEHASRAAGGGAGGARPPAGDGPMQLTEQQQQALEELMKTPPARDVLTGTARGVGYIVSGAVGAAGAIVAMPAYGAYQGGASGFCRGVLGGIVTAVVTIPTVTYMGISEIVVGLWNTPGTTVQVATGHRWDGDFEEWVPDVPYSLPDEEERMRDFDAQAAAAAAARPADGSPGSADRGARSASGGPSRKVADRTYYELLRIEPSATPMEIKKAYRKEALKVHPDKNPDDKDAAAKFQAVGEAYQVLQNEQLRARYDKFGKESTDTSQLVDPAVFFTAMFGSEQFEPYIGKLQMAHVVDVLGPEPGKSKDGKDGADEPGSPREASEAPKRDLAIAQRRREVELAVKLRARLQAYVDGDEAAFVDAMEAEAKQLVDAPFGENLVRSISWVYANRADSYLGSLQFFYGLDALSAYASSCTRDISNQLNVAGMGFETLRVASDVHADAHQKQKEAQERAQSSGDEKAPEIDPEKANKITETVLEMMAHITIIDVEKTVGAVCGRLLDDVSVDADVRRKRAEAMKKLSELLLQAKSSRADPQNWRAAAAAAAASAQGGQGANTPGAPGA